LAAQPAPAEVVSETTFAVDAVPDGTVDSTRTVDVGASFSVDIVVTGTAAAAWEGYQVELEYDDAILDAVVAHPDAGWTMQPVIGVAGANVHQFSSGTLCTPTTQAGSLFSEDDAGTAAWVMTCTEGQVGASTSPAPVFRLVQFAFVCGQPGPATLQLSDGDSTFLLDSDHETYNDATADGTVTCAGVTPTVTATPTPTLPATSAPSGTVTSAPTPSSTPTAVVSSTVVPPPSVTATPVTSSTPIATPTGVPTISAEPDAPGTSTEFTVDAAGGTVSSPDGRVSLAFGPNALPDDTTVTIVQAGLADLPHSGTHPVRRAWDFTATNGSTPITTFNGAVTLTARFAADDLHNTNFASARLYALNESTNVWSNVHGASVDAATRTVSVPIEHFSGYGVGVDPDIDMAPFSNIATTDLHSGAAQLSIPIALPAAPGGLAPQLSLTYDSGRLLSMKSDLALSSWVGMGWELSTGSISDTGDTPKFALEMTGVGGQLRKGSDGVWRTEEHQFLRIERIKPDGTIDESYCANLDHYCQWRITDKQGTQYFFGEDTYAGLNLNASRLRDIPNDPAEYYQWDLSRVRDLNGQEIIYKYTRVCPSDDPCATDEYMDSYVSEISWNSGTYKVEFDVGADSEYFDPPDGQAPQRADAPYDVEACGGQTVFSAPNVRESRRLKELRVRVNGQTQRTFAFNHNITPFTYDGGCDHDWEKSGRMTLTSLAIKGQGDNGEILQTMTFTNTAGTGDAQDLRVAYLGDSEGEQYYWPLLQTWGNGLGGSVSFTYARKDASASGWQPWEHCWESTVVAEKKVVFGAGQPDVVTSYEYYDGPHRERSFQDLTCDDSFPCPFGCGPAAGFSEAYLGYGNVVEYEYDAPIPQGAQVVSHEHLFFTSKTPEDEARTGREYETRTRLLNSGSPDVWHTTKHTWGYTLVEPGNPAVPQDLARFVKLEQTEELLRDTTPGVSAPRTGARYAYDAHGNVTEATTFDGDHYGTTDRTITTTTFHNNTTAWVFVPKSVEVKDEPGTQLRLTNYYYDGDNDQTPAPAIGRLTAESVKLKNDPPNNFSTTFYVYDTYGSPTKYGNVVRASVPTFVKPEDDSAGPPQGQIPDVAPIPFRETVFDDVFHILAETQTNALGHDTAIEFDEVWLKPKRVETPNGHWVRYKYDAFGRPTHVWDELDGTDADTGHTPATTTFAYVWNASERSIAISRRVDGSNRLDSIRCLDGFGREIDTRVENGTGYSRVRTDYDDRGRMKRLTNPFAGSGMNCSGVTDNAMAQNRTYIEYDPLGNATKTFFNEANLIGGPYVEFLYDGLTTTTIDENRHRTREIRNLDARTTTIHEDKGNGGTIAWYPYAATTYENDALGQLKKVTDALGNETMLSYDLGGRKTAMGDPDMGSWSYSYDAAGNLKTQTDARGVVTTLAYDAEDRVNNKTYTHGGATAFPQVTFTYDSYPNTDVCPSVDNTDVGRLTRMQDAAGEQLSCYDVRGRETTTHRTINGEALPYQVGRSFNSADQVKVLTYPDGEQVSHQYNAHGQLTGLVSDTFGNAFIATATYGPTQQLGSLTFGTSPNVTTTYTYDSRMRLSTTITGSLPLQNVSIGYDDASNVTSITDTVGGTETAAYAYDELDRLASMTLNGTPSASYSYDQIGNLVTKTEGVAAPTLTLTYPTPGPGVIRPHAATMASSTAFSRKLVYDHNGNMIGSEEQIAGDDFAFDYDGDNRLVAALRSRPDTPPGSLGFNCVDVGGGGENIDAVDIGLVRAQFGKHWGMPGYDFRANLNWNSGAGDAVDIGKTRAAFSATEPCEGEITRYVRDGNGVLLKKAHSSRAGTTVTDDTTVYIGGIYEKRTVGTAVTVRKYYSAFGRNVAMREVPGGAGAGTVSFILIDHLGGTNKTMDSSGTIVDSIKYWPFGAIRSGTATTTDKLFTGQRQEAGADHAMGLYDYGARFYSTTLGRFVSVDPLVGSGGDPQSWNAYTYVRNNPLVMTDATGMIPDSVHDARREAYRHSKNQGYQIVAGQTWVSAPAMQPYEECSTCVAWRAASDAYAEAGRSQLTEQTSALREMASRPEVDWERIALLGLVGGFAAGTADGYAHANQFKFAQNSIGYWFSGKGELAGYSIQSLAADLGSGKITPQQLDPVLVVRRNGHLYVVEGNRRLAAARLANSEIGYRVVTGQTAANYAWKFTNTGSGWITSVQNAPAGFRSTVGLSPMPASMISGAVPESEWDLWMDCFGGDVYAC
jgi:RHS repeat-associated protein